MHVSDKRVFNFSPNVLKAFDEAKAYAMELDPEKMMSPTVLTSMMMTDGKSLKELMSDSDYHYADSLIRQSTGYGLALFDKMEPIIISALLEESSMGMSISDTSDNMEEEMDLYLYKKAKKQKKKQIGIETVDEQLGALHTLSYEEQAEQLKEAIADIKRPEGGDVDLLKYYIAQDLDSLLTFSDESKMPEKFYKALVTDRNVRMADRIDGFIQKQPTFIAVGALHLPGKAGVVALLRKKGYTVEEWK